eukprot:TRINITY_DN29644_c0_g1_i1.p1 TRINITY_DN29644_c0_g1~~TRINITY_DN29644_c0_g1_i1.p1  ORF type:complete len:119 (+),score=9.51 TRINITY_DN29644_c0_g1_i1:140-496(+)
MRKRKKVLCYGWTFNPNPRPFQGRLYPAKLFVLHLPCLANCLSEIAFHFCQLARIIDNGRQGRTIHSRLLRSLHFVDNNFNGGNSRASRCMLRLMSSTSSTYSLYQVATSLLLQSLPS